MSSEKKNFAPFVSILMIASVLVMIFGLWPGFGMVLNQNNGDAVKTIIGEIGTIILVILVLIGMIFTWLKKRWAYWLFGITSVLMFVGLAIPGVGPAARTLGPAGFLGICTVALIYRQRDLLS